MELTRTNVEHDARRALGRFVGTDGQDLIEYGLVAGLVSVFAVGAVRLLGEQIDVLLWQTIAQNF